jgi:hypothetical protein
MNQITYDDFELFETELLSVDFISFNIKRITSDKITRLASYFQNLGFNSYQKQLDSNQFKQEINNNNSYSNQFEVYFILKIPYQAEIIQLQFPGVSGKQFYKLIKQRAVQWEKFPNPVFSRLDVVYQRISKSKDTISTIDFINSCYLQFQELHSSKNLLSERNQKGLILKIGNRRSSRHYRIYTNQKNNLLRFEAEMKGDLIKDFQDLLITSSAPCAQGLARPSREFGALRRWDHAVHGPPRPPRAAVARLATCLMRAAGTTEPAGGSEVDTGADFRMGDGPRRAPPT